jgi:hypothetical protein
MLHHCSWCAIEERDVGRIPQDELDRALDEAADEWYEERIDRIGQNGGDGEHYANGSGSESYEEGSECSINHPRHYTEGEVECIEAIKSALTEEEWVGYLKGNIFKYVWRERHKGGVESLKKARWYLIGRLGKEGVCEYMTGYNQQVVYTPPNFRCIKHKDRVPHVR